MSAANNKHLETRLPKYRRPNNSNSLPDHAVCKAHPHPLADAGRCCDACPALVAAQAPPCRGVAIHCAALVQNPHAPTGQGHQAHDAAGRGVKGGSCLRPHPVLLCSWAGQGEPGL